MLTIIPQRPAQEPQARKLKNALEENGCDSYIDMGYANDILSRSYTGSRYVIFLYESKSHLKIVSLYDRWEDTHNDIPTNKFINNWSDYLE